MSSKLRRNLTIAFTTLVLLTPSFTYAQKKPDDYGKQAVQNELLQSIKASQPADITLPASTKSQILTPYKLEEEQPQNLDQLLADSESKNKEIIDELQKLIAKDPQNPNAPEWLFRVAEIQYQTKHYNYLRQRRQWLKATETCDFETNNCPPEPTPDYDEAIRTYKEILDKYPKYNRNNEVLFKLGDALIRNNREKEGVSYLHKLIQTYPKSTENIDATYLAIAEFYFSQKITGTAQAAYQKIVNDFPKSPYKSYALYKLAWTYINLADEESYEEAIKIFKQVIEDIDAANPNALTNSGQIDENKLAQGTVSFRNQAINDLASTYANLPQGWKQAKNYLQSRLPSDKLREKLESLAQVLEARANYEEQIELTNDLIQSDPQNPHLYLYAQSLINAHNNINQVQKAKEITNLYLQQLNPNATWAQKLKNTHPNDVKKASDFVQNTLNNRISENLLAIANDKIDLNIKNNALSQARDDLNTLLTDFPTAKNFIELNFYYAYTLDELSDTQLESLKKQFAKNKNTFNENAKQLIPTLQKAAIQYQKTIELLKQASPSAQNTDYLKTAANRVVFVNANILATSDPAWSIVNSAKTTSFKNEKRDEPLRDAIQLNNEELSFVQAAEQYAALFPKDDQTPPFLWRAAEIYRAKNHYNNAAQRFDDLITNFPSHEYAAVAVGSIFQLYEKAQNWPKIEYWAAWLRDKRNFKYYTENELENAEAFAISQQARIELESQNFEKAALKWISIQPKFPNRPQLYAPALQAAANAYAQKPDFQNALKIYESAFNINEMPTHWRADIAYEIASIYLNLANYKQAADNFKKSFELYILPTESQPDDPSRIYIDTALSALNASQLYTALNDQDNAKQILAKYITINENNTLDLYKNSDIWTNTQDENAKPALNNDIANFTLINLIQDNDSQQAIEILNQLVQSNNIQTKASAHLKLAEIERTQSNIKNAQNNIQNALKLAPQLNTNLQLAINFENAEIKRQIFEDVKLEFPISTLRKRIEQKAKARTDAETLYKNIINQKNAYYSTASAYRLAQMALHFRDAFKALPIPKELENKPEQREDYLIWLEDELIFPAEDAATNLLSYARDISLQLSVFNKWTQKTAKELSKLQPSKYPLSIETLTLPNTKKP